MKKDKHILIFGTSITWGAWDKDGGWAERLKNYFCEKHLKDPNYFYLTYNLGVSGNTTEHILKRFEFEVEQRSGEVPGETELVVIFDFGGNDAAFIHSKKDFWVPREKFAENTQKLIELARKFTSHVFLIGGHPVNEEITDPVPWNKDVSYRNKDAKEYDGIMASICEKEKAVFIDVFDLLDINTDFYDGLHPNSEGHKKIYEEVKEKLIENKII